MTNTPPIPIELVLHKKSRTLEVVYSTGENFILSCEYLRIFSPSADNKIPPTHKEHVNILKIDPVGQYAIKPVFSDGHSTGIYSWQTLYDLCINQETKWQAIKKL